MIGVRFLTDDKVDWLYDNAAEMLASGVEDVVLRDTLKAQLDLIHTLRMLRQERDEYRSALEKIGDPLYEQVCPACGDTRTPDCEGHQCHKCGQARYKPGRIYRGHGETACKIARKALVKYPVPGR